MVEYGISTASLAGANAPKVIRRAAPANPDTDVVAEQDDVLTDEHGNVIPYEHASAPDGEDGTVEVEADERVPGHPVREAVRFQHNTQAGNRERVRSLPKTLPTNPLRSGRRSK